MKGVLGWIKSHLVIVICTIVIPTSLILGFIFSSGWNKEIREEQEKRASNAYSKIKSARVTYVIPSLLPGEEALTDSRPPNRVVTEFFKEQREERTRQASGVVDEVERFNRRDHELLEPELLPEPREPQKALSLKYSMLAQVAGDTQMGTESVYVGVFSRIGAGGPPDPVKLATSIQDLRDRQSERMLAESGTGSLTDEQQEELDALLRDRRIAEAQRRAKEISVYAGLESFDSQGFGDKTAVIPPISRTERESSVPPSLNEVFGWNFDYWVVSDVLAAIDAANTDAGGTRANVEHATVKRIERLSVEKLPVEVTTEPGAGSMDEFADEGVAAGSATDPSVSVTGRVSTEAFDVVRVKLTLIVDAQKLPRLFEAFAETNLMTVLDLDISEVDIWEDLRQGYYYGDGSVVRADVLLETIWLRDWTAPMMPEAVKEALGIPTEDEFAEDDEG